MRALERFFKRAPKEDLVAPKNPPKGDPTNMDRRSFLKAAGKVVGGAALGVGVVEPWLRSGHLSSEQNSEHKPALSSEDVVDELGPPSELKLEPESEIDFTALNRDTALPVAAGFIGFVGNAARGGSLGPVSIAAINGLELNRLSTLYYRGGKEGKHHAEEELTENIVAGALAMGLAGISDLTTSAVRFEAQQLLKTTAQLEKHDLADIASRPEATASVGTWERYCEKIEDDLVDQVTRIIAVTGMIAPFSTTYTSSVIANQMKTGTVRLLFEHNVARTAIIEKQAGRDVSTDQLEITASQRANELSKQFTDLLTALTANIQGGILAGDPPQFFGVVDQWGEWTRLAKAEAYGLANDAVMTVALTSWWCQEAGINNANVSARLFDHSKELAHQAGGLLPITHKAEDRALQPALASAALDEATFSEHHHVDQRVKQQLRRLTRYQASFSLRGYAEKKARWLGQLPGIGSMIESLNTLSANQTQKTEGHLEQLRRMLLEKRVTNNPAPEQPTLDELVESMVAEVEATADEESQPDESMFEEPDELTINHNTTETHFFNHTGTEVRDALLTQLPAVGPIAVLAEQGLTTTFNLQGGAERSSVDQVVAAATAALTSEAVLSSLADNVAAYKYGYKVLRAMVETVYGKDTLELFPTLHDAIFAVALKLAEQAGGLTKLGNGPNFSQEDTVLMSPTEVQTYTASLSPDELKTIHIEPAAAGTMQVVHRPLPFTLYDNKYANAANAALLAVSVGWLTLELRQVEKALAT